jgi:hypothetical protein
MAENTPPKPSKDSEPSPETFGPLTVRRYVKDDDRTLIMYSRRPDATAADRPA